ncbi:MAG: hypothetical protein LUF87_04665 [Alistipes sp.]|nr:hypothetical protein [Alistipes sp.]
MDRILELKKQIQQIEDKIRRAPQDTPNKVVFEWYLEIDDLRDRIRKIEDGEPDVEPNESNMLDISSADAEDLSSEQERNAFIEEWNRDGDTHQTWSQIVGTAKE